MEIDEEILGNIRDRIMDSIVDIAIDAYGDCTPEKFWNVAVTLVWITMSWFHKFYETELGRPPTDDELRTAAHDLVDGWIKMSQEGE